MVHVSHIRGRLLTPGARILLALTQNPNTSQGVLAARLGISLRNVVRHVDELERAGYISVDRSRLPRGGCVYTVHLSEEEIAALGVLGEREDARLIAPPSHQA